MVSINNMNTQINLRLPEKLLASAKTYSIKNGFGTVQEFIKETLREKLFDDEPEFTKKEIDIIMEIFRISKEKNLFGTEEDLYKRFRRDKK